MKNPNRPAKGSRITVEPIRKLKDIKAIKKLLTDNQRDYLLFTIGINNGLRVGDLLRLRVRDIHHLRVGQHITIRESKTKKDNILVVNKSVYKALKNYLYTSQSADDDFLFASRKGNNAIKISAVNNLVKKWTTAINLCGNYGAHSLRKTWGYLQRTEYGVGFEVIAKRFNHSNPAVTMRYLGIQDKEIHNTLMNEIG
jgi:integrase